MRALVASLLLVAAAPAAAGRVAVVVGNNVGMADELRLRYAESDAARIARVLVDLGGFAPAEVHLLAGRRAEDLRDIMRRAEWSEVSPFDDASLFFFYYSGHANGRDLHMAGSKLPVSELRELIDSSGARITVALIDSCKSGALTRAKGATLGPPYEIELLQDPEVKGRIVITSSSEDEISQESDLIEGSFFTHHWVSGLYGRADSDDDKRVTLEEAYRYAHFRTIEETIASSGGVQHPSYRWNLSGQGNVVLANLTRATAELRITTSGERGEYFVLDPEKRLVLTEAAQSRGTARVRLPPGRYRIRKREAGRFLVRDVLARAGEVVGLDDTDMTAVAYSAQAVKAEPRLALTHHGVWASAGARSSIARGERGGLETRVGYQLGFGRLLVEPRFAYRRTADWRAELDFGLAFGLAVRDGSLGFALALDAGLVWHREDPLETVVSELQLGGPLGLNPRGTVDAKSKPGGALALGMQGGVLVRVSRRIAGGLTVFAEGNAGIALFELDNDRRLASVLAGRVGLAYEID